MRDGTETGQGRAHGGTRSAGGCIHLQVVMAGMLAMGLAACGDDPVGTEGHDEAGVSLLFEAAGHPGGSAATAADLGFASGRTIEGTNGTLVLQSMHATVEEVELERADAGEDFELGPFLTEIPLVEGAAVEVFRSPVPAGRYEELELEIEEPDDDLLGEIRQEEPYWPDDASLRISGVFQGEDGSAQEFLVFMDAEIEVELEFEPYLVVSEDDPDRTVTVTLNPSLWFLQGDGSVVDLTEYHCDPPTVCPVPEFEAEIEREGGAVFTEVEWG